MPHWQETIWQTLSGKHVCRLWCPLTPVVLEATAVRMWRDKDLLWSKFILRIQLSKSICIPCKYPVCTFQNLWWQGRKFREGEVKCIFFFFFPFHQYLFKSKWHLIWHGDLKSHHGALTCSRPDSHSLNVTKWIKPFPHCLIFSVQLKSLAGIFFFSPLWFFTGDFSPFGSWLFLFAVITLWRPALLSASATGPI